MFLVSGPGLRGRVLRGGRRRRVPDPQRANDRRTRPLARGRRTPQRPGGGRGRPVAPYAPNLIVHASNDRLAADLELIEAHRAPIVVTSVGSPRPVVERIHAYGGLVFSDVASLRHARAAAESGVDGLILLCAGAGGNTGWLPPVRLRSGGARVLRRAHLGGRRSDGRRRAARGRGARRRLRLRRHALHRRPRKLADDAIGRCSWRATPTTSC